jgi:hypothetical protein
MFGREEKPAIDVHRVVNSAVDAFLDVDRGRQNGDTQKQDHHIGPVGSLAIGILLAAGARAAYSRAKKLDVADVAERFEERLSV